MLPLIRPNGHLLPDGEGKEGSLSIHRSAAKRLKPRLSNQVELKSLARFGRGGTNIAGG